MKLPFINDGIFESQKSLVERGESSNIIIIIIIYSIHNLKQCRAHTSTVIFCFNSQSKTVSKIEFKTLIWMLIWNFFCIYYGPPAWNLRSILGLKSLVYKLNIIIVIFVFINNNPTKNGMRVIHFISFQFQSCTSIKKGTVIIYSISFHFSILSTKYT